MASRLIVSSILTPYKLPLLALVAAYCSGIFPKKSDAALLAFIVKTIEQHPLVDNEPVSVSMSLAELLSRIRLALLESTNTKDQAVVDYELIEARLLLAVWSWRDLDTFHQFIIKSKSLLVNTAEEGKEILSELPKSLLPKKLLTKRSFLGRFVLNCIKDFEALEFEEAQKFWSAFVQYRQSSYEQFTSIGDVKTVSNIENYFGDNVELNSLISKINNNMFQSKFDSTSELGIPERFQIVSAYDLSKALSKQIRLLESFGTPTPDYLKEVLVTMSKQGNDIFPSSYYLTYLECVTACDYEGAFKALHGYFDYMMSNSSKSYYQYALLSLVTLHAKFNSNRQALEAIKEAILVARENNDTGCLNYLLSWLFNFLKNKPELKHDFFESNEQLLEFLKKKNYNQSSDNITNELELNSKAYQMEATQALLDGAPLNRILESVIKSEYLALNDDYDNRSFIINCCLQSSIWSRVGINDLAELYVNISLDTSQSQHNINNVYQSWLRLAWLEYDNGNIDNLFKILKQKSAENKTAAITAGLGIVESIFTVRQAINRNRLTFSHDYIQRLKDQEASSDIDIKNELTLLSALVEYKLQNTTQAVKILTDEIKRFDKNPIMYNNYWYIKFSILYCRIFCGSGNTIRVLPLINKLVKLTKQSSLVSLANELILLFARVLFTLQKFNNAKELLTNSMPQILQYNNVHIKSEAYLLLVQTDYYLIRQGSLVDVKTFMSRLNLAVDGFKKLNDYFSLQNCFELEIAGGKLLNNSDMINHGQSSLQKVENQMNQEYNYGILI